MSTQLLQRLQNTLQDQSRLQQAALQQEVAEASEIKEESVEEIEETENAEIHAEEHNAPFPYHGRTKKRKKKKEEEDELASPETKPLAPPNSGNILDITI